MEINRITSARVLAAYTLELQFGDGFVGSIDLKPALWGTVFQPPQDASYFAQFRLDTRRTWHENEEDCDRSNTSQ